MSPDYNWHELFCNDRPWYGHPALNCNPDGCKKVGSRAAESHICLPWWPIGEREAWRHATAVIGSSAPPLTVPGLETEQFCKVGTLQSSQTESLSLRKLKFCQYLHERHSEKQKKPQGTETLRDDAILILRDSSVRFSYSVLFHQKYPPWTLIHILSFFQICFQICGVIRIKIWLPAAWCSRE
jgi:hypothetical protein